MKNFRKRNGRPVIPQQPAGAPPPAPAHGCTNLPRDPASPPRKPEHNPPWGNREGALLKFFKDSFGVCGLLIRFLFSRPIPHVYLPFCQSFIRCSHDPPRPRHSLSSLSPRPHRRVSLLPRKSQRVRRAGAKRS